MKKKKKNKLAEMKTKDTLTTTLSECASEFEF
jgi:hypothetical protein